MKIKIIYTDLFMIFLFLMLGVITMFTGAIIKDQITMIFGSVIIIASLALVIIGTFYGD
jgi:hypothetical protein